MLGRTAGGLFWMFRYLERSENIARLVEAGLRMGLTRADAQAEWSSVLSTAAAMTAFGERHTEPTQAAVTEFLLRDMSYPSSVLASIENARNNARSVRTALTREVWEAVNDCWLTLKRMLAAPLPTSELPRVLDVIRQKSALVRGALHGTMLRNENFNFARAGTYIERGDSTARILDVKYYVLLPSASMVGSSIDNAQWETILRSTSSQRAFRWLHAGEQVRPPTIVQFMTLDSRAPRSLRFCLGKLVSNLGYLEKEYNVRRPCTEQARALLAEFDALSVDEIFSVGLHEFLQDFIARNSTLAAQIEEDYRFNR
jgi:uncharacterized alpha-E superfamily protein